METVTNTVETQATPETPAVVVAKGKQPDATQFALVWNQSESRQDAVTRFNAAGFHMTYGALVARVKAYTKADRPGGAINLKSMPAAARGRRINAEAVNAAIAANTTAEAVKDEPKA